MKNLKNITDAQNDYPEMVHVVNSNEVHSFNTMEEAKNDLLEAIEAEKEFNTGFTPEIIN